MGENIEVQFKMEKPMERGLSISILINQFFTLVQKMTKKESGNMLENLRMTKDLERELYISNQ